MVIGDLNSNSTTIGCRTNNPSGMILEEILEKEACVLVNNKDPTYHDMRNSDEDYHEILDLCLCSTSVASKVSSFQVQYECDMKSDHCPICVSLKLARYKTRLENSGAPLRFNFLKTDWTLFK